MPVYFMDDPSTRHRAIKYTPEHMHCMSCFYGPITPPNTGLLAFQALGRDVPDFRIVSTGVVTDVDQNIQVRY
jgi:ribosome biogenesis protein BMS1